MNHIPKGSKFYGDNKFIAITNKIFNIGYLPDGKDFTPNIENGTLFETQYFRHKGELIYLNPYFADELKKYYNFEKIDNDLKRDLIK